MELLPPTDWGIIGTQLVQINAVIIFSMALVGFTFKKIFNWLFKLVF